MQTKSAVWKLLFDLSSKSGISDISINGPKQIFVEKSGRYIQLQAHIPLEEMMIFIDEVAAYNQKECTEDIPILDGNLPDGSRINIIRSPFVIGPPAISIRKYSPYIKSFDTNTDIFGLDKKSIAFLKALVKWKMNIVVSGGTGVGKTTLLNLLLSEIDPIERIVTIEDTPELSIPLPNLVRLESGGRSLLSHAKLTTRDLVKNTLRMRPDRIIIGEARGGELFDLIQAMNTGHDGSMTSLHASSAGECFMRMETLFLLAGFDLPVVVIRRHISTAVNFIIQIGRSKEGQRVILEINEITGMEGPTILAQKIFIRDEEELRFTGIVPKHFETMVRDGILPFNFFERD